MESEIEDFLLVNGALRVGFATLKTLEGGPPSADLRYLLSDAQSAIGFALPLNKDYIRSFLSKKNWGKHVIDNIEVNMQMVRLSGKLIALLEEKGFKAKQPPAPGNYISFRQTKGLNESNLVEQTQYRQEIPNWRLILPPYLSLRYIAVRSGVGSFGWSGNVGIRDVGATIILGAVVTSARLEPTEPLPPEESFCDKCNLCIASCTSGYLEQKKEMFVILSGKKFTHCARRSKLRCQMVCSGFSGLHPSGKWSTWSPGRYILPEDDKKMFGILANAVRNYQKWPDNTSPEYKSPYKVRLTCAFCQLICFGNRKETTENFKALKNSGCVLQEENGDYVILPADEAKEHFEKMPLKHRNLYQERIKTKNRKVLIPHT